MQIKNRITALLAGVLLVTGFTMCEKPPGKGGRATVRGKVFATDFDNTQRVPISRGYQPGERVYIVYGEGTMVGDDIRTSYDGSYEFRYLTKGKYKVFANSLDTTEYFKGRDKLYPVILEFEIKDPKEVKTLPDLHINI